MTGKNVVNGVASLLCGLGLGWLIGLSVTPVIQGVITALLTLIISVLTLLVGIRKTPPKKEEDATSAERKLPEVEPLPLALFVFALAVGASVGVVARTHQWLGPQTGASGTGQEVRKPLEPVLFTSLSPEECTRFKAAPNDQLERIMAQSHNPRVREFVRRCAGNPQCLRAAVEELLCTGKD